MNTKYLKFTLKSLRFILFSDEFDSKDISIIGVSGNSIFRASLGYDVKIDPNSVEFAAW